MFDLALHAGLPIIGVRTDDPVNFTAVVQLVAQAKPARLPQKYQLGSPAALPNGLYWTDRGEEITVDLYRFLAENGKQLVVINPDRDPLIFDAGELPTPESMVEGYLKDVVPEEQVAPLMRVLKGLSMKTLSEVVTLTQARTGGTKPSEVRKTRTQIMGTTQGLSQVDTGYDFYVWPPKLEDWVSLNRAFFLGDHHPRLVPRGIMLEGAPGVGKSMAAKVIANAFGVPLYRVDIASTLVKYVGDSEARFARSLQIIEREAPCVVLLDEVEKIFGTKDDSGVTQRLLSQLLWWLAEHRSRVFVVMTTNDSSTIPRELFRSGRIDLTMKLPKLSISAAESFAWQVFESVISEQPDPTQKQIIAKDLAASVWNEFAHADVAETVYYAIKREGWAQV